MKKLMIGLTLGLGLLVVSCNKDQSSVKKLEGSWTATKYTFTSGGTSYNLLEDGSFKMTFEKCKLKTDEWCGCTSTVSSGGFSFSDLDMVYRVSGDGTMLETKEHKDSTTIESMTIVELKKGMLTLQDVESGETTDIEMSQD